MKTFVTASGEVITTIEFEPTVIGSAKKKKKKSKEKKQQQLGRRWEGEIGGVGGGTLV